jgi:hypothetical protein
VYDLDGSREHPTVACAADGLVCRRDEHRTQTLSAAKQAVADCIRYPGFDAAELRRAEVREGVVDRAAVHRETQRHEIRHEGR